MNTAGCRYCKREKQKENKKPRLVVESAKEINHQYPRSRVKTLSEITSRYYWPEMYNDICSYVSISAGSLFIL